MKQDSRTVIMVSYESGDYASCPAEWADDKVDAILSLGYRVVLVTSPASRLHSRANLRVVKVPSISFFDYRDEMRRGGLSTIRPSALAMFSWPIAAIFGSVFDGLFRLLAGNMSWGRYSWAISVFPVIAWQLIRNKNAFLFATGGPSSAQLSAVAVGKLLGNRPTLEFQDPIYGSQMSMSPLATRILLAMEEYLLRGAARVFFVTKGASDDAKSRLPHLTQSINYLYPGAKYFEFRPSKTHRAPEQDIELVHMGSLYGSRNLDNFFIALDNVYALRGELRGKIHVKNIGNLSVSNRSSYMERSDFVQVEPMSREAALRLASDSDVLLLVQHTDERSEATIPYKTYDYLNLGLPVFGLLRNEELEGLILKHGGFCASSRDVKDIESGLLDVLESRARLGKRPETYSSGISIIDQVKVLLGRTHD